METLTFYSYKGGTGRSLLLANTARYLADLGKRVVALDFDLEAPGLHYKLRPEGAKERTIDLSPERGLVDYLLAASADGSESVAIMDYVLRVPLPATTTGELYVFPAGAAPSGAYWRGLTTLTRGDFFTNPDGSGIAACLDLKARIEQEIGADFLLIDSRTGITEMAGLATTLLADTVVCLMIDNPESLAGTRAVLRSFGEAPRLPGLDPIRLLPVLSRASRDDAEIRQRILKYLNEADSGTEHKLALERIYVLRTDPVLAEAERLLLTDVEIPLRSALYQDYIAFLRVLVTADPALADAAERRRTTVARMKEFLTRQQHDRRHRAPETFDIEQIEEGVEFGDNQKRYADLVVHDSKDHTRVLMAVEYVNDLTASEAWRWWENSTDLQSVFLISQEGDSYLKMRLFTRGGRVAKFREHHERFSRFIKWPVSFTALGDPGDWSVESMLKAVERGEESFIGLLVAEWEHASFVTLHGGYSYRPNVARQIFDGLARVTDPEIETRILWITMPDLFERQYKSPIDDRVMDNLTISELHTPLWWRLSVQSRINFSVERQSRHRLGSVWLDAEIDMLAHEGVDALAQGVGAVGVGEVHVVLSLSSA